MKKDLRTQIVVKSNGLIESSYRLSVPEQRIVLACIGQIAMGDKITDQTMYTVNVSEIADMAGLGDRTDKYTKLAAAAHRLYQREVCIRTEPDGTTKRDEELWTRWVQSCKYSKGEGQIRVRFATDMIPYLIELKDNFTKYRLADISALSSSYSMRLYELLIQWQSVGTREVSVEDLRSMLAVADDKYPMVAKFKRHVIDHAVAEINQKTNLTVSYGQRKRGARIVAFQFKFRTKGERAAGNRKITLAVINAEARPGEEIDDVMKRLRAKGKGS